ncbi:hypothetical protein TraAM80_02245 [Trypanosoma rangeli]|uniref:Uncharacterized protein n=1 Tax=Trypanosoma rangeli TaxID=5698 RepID=A0A3R7KKI7_TRYRA|nr:uncharacterized protein TraAM80_02245 [Trypanosoma rangeli]RNF09298.1 hypothetical protein TraAM80_02245 [Trypanosoma rangeli]|eukprot:RNF09298.1 hypothetical protein TraAM80_02245 [Trypanosoma rangeli]
MQKLGGGSGQSPSQLSSSLSLQAEPASVKTFVARAVELLASAREDGGFSGTLRYYDLRLLLQRLGCVWDLERLDDCWYDMVRGRPASVVEDMPWAAQCIYEHLRGDRVEFPARTPSTQLCGDVRALTSQRDEPDDLAAEADVSQPDPLHTRSSQLQVPMPTHDPEKQPEKSQEAVPSRQQQGLSAKKRHPTITRETRFASPTLSSVRRDRPTSVPARRKQAGEASPRRRRTSPLNAATAEVFRRLIEDADRRRRRASPPTPTLTLPVAETRGGMVTPAKAQTGPADRLPSATRISRHPSQTGQNWNKPTKSYVAKLAPEPASVDCLEAAAPTPYVERREPLGPSTYVPSGYVEAVARLRRFAASRNHLKFVDSLRATTPVSAATGAAVERAPILRLPVSDSVEGRTCTVDVRLAAPVRSHRLMVPQDVPYDDPSRVLIKNFLSGCRVRSGG